MPNQLTFSPTHPRRAKTHHVPSFILGSSTSSPSPSWDEELGNFGRAVENHYTSGFLSPTTSSDDLFEHPGTLSSVRSLHS